MIYSRALLVFLGAAYLMATARGVTLTISSQCSGPLAVFYQGRAQPTPEQLAVLTPGTSTDIDIDDSFAAGGAVWGGNTNRALAGLAEFKIPANGQSVYDISLVDAYNVGIEIEPENENGDLCKTIRCTIAGLQGFCGQGTDNSYTPAGDGTSEACTNMDGPQPASQPPCCCSTAITQKFKGACPDAISFSRDDASSTFACDSPTGFNIIFCPDGNSSVNNQPCPQS